MPTLSRYPLVVVVEQQAPQALRDQLVRLVRKVKSDQQGLLELQVLKVTSVKQERLVRWVLQAHLVEVVVGQSAPSNGFSWKCPSGSSTTSIPPSC